MEIAKKTPEVIISPYLKRTINGEQLPAIAYTNLFEVEIKNIDFGGISVNKIYLENNLQVFCAVPNPTKTEQGEVTWSISSYTETSLILKRCKISRPSFRKVSTLIISLKNHKELARTQIVVMSRADQADQYEKVGRAKKCIEKHPNDTPSNKLSNDKTEIEERGPIEQQQMSDDERDFLKCKNLVKTDTEEDVLKRCMDEDGRVICDKCFISITDDSVAKQCYCCGRYDLLCFTCLRSIDNPKKCTNGHTVVFVDYFKS